MKDKLRNACSFQRVLGEIQELYPHSPFTTENDVESYLTDGKWKRMTLGQLHELKIYGVRQGNASSNTMSPFLLGMCYYYHLLHCSWTAEEDTVELSNKGIGNIDVQKEFQVGDVKETWKSQNARDSPFAGVFFVADQYIKNTAGKALCNRLVSELGASLLGVEHDEPLSEAIGLKKGGARMVFENVAAFALNISNEKVQLDATHYNLFTATIRIGVDVELPNRCLMCTITAKFLEDIIFIYDESRFNQVERTRVDDRNRWNVEQQEIDRKQEGTETTKSVVLVVLGLEDYRTDLILYRLAHFLNNNQYNVSLVLYFDEIELWNGQDLLKIETEAGWNEFVNGHIEHTSNVDSNDKEAIHEKTERDLTNAKKVLQISTRSAPWETVISPVMRKCRDPPIHPPIPGLKHKCLLPPMEVWSYVLQKEYKERVTLPLNEVYKEHGIQLTRRKVETISLFTLSGTIMKCIPQLLIPPN